MIRTKAAHLFSPIDFAMVMTTGILAIASLLEGFLWLARAIYYIDLLLFFILLFLLLKRLLFEWPVFLSDFRSMTKGPVSLPLLSRSA